MNFGLKLVACAVILTAFSACGKKGDVKPPSKSEISPSFSDVSFSISPVLFSKSRVLFPKAQVRL